MKYYRSQKSRRLLPRRSRSALTRPEMMARIQSKDTAPEVRVCSAIHGRGLRFRKHVADLPGKPDLANRKNKWAIFVHGCFWHSHKGCALASKPKTNSAYWSPKLLRTVKRDRVSIRELRRQGFEILVIWECDTRIPAKLTVIAVNFARRVAGTEARWRDSPLKSTQELR
jgi:DNA mismatch endonuclease (patch repair protein)